MTVSTPSIKCELTSISTRFLLDMATGKYDLESRVVRVWTEAVGLIGVAYPEDNEAIAEGAGIMLVCWRLSHHRLSHRVTDRIYTDSIRVLRAVGASDSYLVSIGFLKG